MIRFPSHTPHYPLFRKCISYHVSFSITGHDHNPAVGILNLINDWKSSFFFDISFRALNLCFNDLLLRMGSPPQGLIVSIMISYSFIPFTSFIMQFFGSYTYILSQKSRLCKMYSAQNIRRFIGVFHYIQASSASISF